jgi:hypothetical protein
MSAIIIHVLCEGKAEKRFSNSVLRPYLQTMNHNVIMETTLLRGSGGMGKYQQVQDDLKDLFRRYPHMGNDSAEHFFTTMFDLYGLSHEFPNYDVAMKIHDAYQKVEALEKAFYADIKEERFIPYIQLHEFEALVFCGVEHLLVDYPGKEKQIDNLRKVVTEHNGEVELINDSVHTAPSKRIESEIGEQYNKPASGAYVTQQVGIPALKEQCPHFKEWVERLEQLIQ